MQVTIIGLGLIGASIGQALRARHGDKVTVIGYDSDQEAHNNASKVGAVNRSEWNLDDSVKGSELVIVAAPANAVYDIFEACGPHFEPGAIIIDTSSSKRAVTDWADQLLPSTVDFIGIDPLAGAGSTGQKDARADLFEGKRVTVMPTINSRESSIKAATSLIDDLGGKPMFMDIDEHDSFSAAVNGLPLVVAASLLSVASASPSWREISSFVGSNFQTMTQPASQDPALGHATAVTNPEMMVHWIDQLVGVLSLVRDSIADEENRYNTDSALADIFVNAWEQKLRLDNGIEPGRQSENPLPTSGEATMSLMLGRLGSQLMNRTKLSQRDPTKYDRRRMK